LRRRDFFVASASFASTWTCFATQAQKKYKIGICDWTAKARGSIEAFKVAKSLHLDGVQFSYDPEQTLNLKSVEFQTSVLSASKEQNIEISSLAMGVYNKYAFAKGEQTLIWAYECLDIMSAINQKLVLFAFFGNGDIKGKHKEIRSVIDRLKHLAPVAEKKGLTIGLETWLNQEEHMFILDAVGSNAVKVFYDTANMHKMGYDIHEEIRWLGQKGALSQIHFKENGKRLGQGSIDFEAVRDDLIAINYKDWIIIEGAVEGDFEQSQLENSTYVNQLFNSQ